MGCAEIAEGLQEIGSGLTGAMTQMEAIKTQKQTRELSKLMATQMGMPGFETSDPQLATLLATYGVNMKRAAGNPWDAALATAKINNLNEPPRPVEPKVTYIEDPKNPGQYMAVYGTPRADGTISVPPDPSRAPNDPLKSPLPDPNVPPVGGAPTPTTATAPIGFDQIISGLKGFLTGSQPAQAQQQPQPTGQSLSSLVTPAVAQPTTTGVMKVQRVNGKLIGQ